MTSLNTGEHSFTSWDGARLFYRSWHPRCLQGKAVVLFHSGHEHSGRMAHVVEALDIPGVSFFAWDARGHGLSPGKRGYADSFHDLVRDADAFIAALTREFDIPEEDIAVLGHSEGSVVASSLVLHHRPRLRGMVLGSPALRIKLYLPFGRRLVNLWARINPRGFVPSFVTSSMLTHDREEMRRRDRDPLIRRPIGTRVLSGLLDEGRRLVERAPAIRVPTLILSAGADRVVRLSTQRDFFARLGSERKEHIVYPGFYHHVFHEQDRHLPIGRAHAFLEDLFVGGSRS